MDLTITSIEDYLEQQSYIASLITKGLQAGNVVLTFGRESKSRLQEEKYHAMLADFEPVKIDQMGLLRTYEADIWKAQMLREFDLEMRANGEPLRHPGRRVLSLDGQELMYVRPTSTKFLKSEAIQFIEFLYFRGTELEVKWSEKALAVYAEYHGAE